MTPLTIIVLYLCLLLGVAVLSNVFLKKTAGDFFLASRSIGPFMLFMSLFGTTMTAFSLTGSSGFTFKNGIVTYGLMGSWSALVHTLIFFLVGAKVWALGKRHGYLTQLSYLRDRYQSSFLTLLLFPLLVGFIMLYVLMGAIGAGSALQGIAGLEYKWGVALVSSVVLVYVFFGGMRGTAWANTMQTLVFLIMGAVAFVVIVSDLGGPQEATRQVIEHANAEVAKRAVRTDFNKGVFASYCLIPISVGMFPHLFQHWLTAKKASNFKLSVAAFPFCILILWAPCVLIGMWATASLPLEVPGNEVLPRMVSAHAGNVLSGLIGAGILAAMMSSMDSQFLCLGSMFTNDFYLHFIAKDRPSERSVVWMGRMFVISIVVATYFIALYCPKKSVFGLGVWCFTGFTSLFPILVGGLYWKRSNKYGAIASVVVVACMWLYYIDRALEPGGFLLLGVLPVVLMLAASTLAFVVASLVTPPPDEAHIAKFFAPGPG